MFKENSKKCDIDYENEFKVVVAGNPGSDCNSRVHQLKSLDSFSRSSESLALSVTSIGEHPKVEKERRKKKTRSASRGKKEERDNECDYGVSRDRGESFISGVLANVKREKLSIMGESEEERLRLMNMRLEGKLSVISQESEETLREQAKLKCDLEMIKKEAEGLTKRSEGLAKEHQQWSHDKVFLNEHNADLEKRIAMLLSNVEIKENESFQVKQQLTLCKDMLEIQKQNMETMKEDVAMKEAVISDLKKKVSSLYSQLQLLNIYHENSEYQAEQVRLELEMAKNARSWIEEQLHSVEIVRDQLQAEVQRVRKSLEETKCEREIQDHKNQSLEVKLLKLQDARLHDTTQLLFELEQLQKEIIASGEEKELLEERYAAMSLVYDNKVCELEEECLRAVNLQKQYEELAQELQDTKDRLRGSLDDLDMLECEASELRKKVASLDVVLETKVSEIAALEAENVELNNSILEWRTKAEERNICINEMSEDLTNVRNSLERVSTERDQCTMFIAQLRETCEKVAEEFEGSRQAVLAKDEALRLMEDINEETKVQLEHCRAEIETNNCVMANLRTEKDQVTDCCAQLQTSHSLVRQELDYLRESLSEAHMSMAGMEDEISKLTISNGQCTSQREETEFQLAQLQICLQEAQKQIEELSFVQGQYADLLERHKRTETQLVELESEHQSLKATFDWTTKDLEARLVERESELAKIVSIKDEVEQSCQKERLSMERAQSQLQDSIESAKFTHAVELATRETQYREQLEQSEREFSQMCQEKIRCESAIGSLQEHINGLVDDYNERLKECRTKMLSLEEKSTAYADYEHKSRQLMEELARKKGEIEGLLAEWKKMKMHAGVVETALAKREASVVEMADRHRITIDEKDSIIDELTNELKKQREYVAINGETRTKLQREIETNIATIDSMARHANVEQGRLANLERELNRAKLSEQSLLDENEALRETDRKLHMELERKCEENRVLMRLNQQLNEQIEKLTIVNEASKSSLRVLQSEFDQRSLQIEEISENRNETARLFKSTKKDMSDTVKDMLQKKESLIRTAELSQQREVLASSVLCRLRAEVKRILLEEKISTNKKNSTITFSGEQFQELYKLLNEDDVSMPTTKPLSRLSKCIEDLRCQIDSMQEDVYKEFNEYPIS